MRPRFVLHMKSRLSMKTKPKMTVLLILTSVCVILVVSYVYCNRKAQNYLDDERRDIPQLETSLIINRVQQIAQDKDKVQQIRETIKPINDQQRVGHVKKINATYMLKALDKFKYFTKNKLDTILVIQVHGNQRYVNVLLESLWRVLGIHESLLIFVHDYYDAEIYDIINDVQFTRVMQIFYPYSIQLHPYRFPGEDLKFCPQLNKCINSNERDPIHSQRKLFWWWTINQVFDHVEILKKYDGFIYFLEVEQYLTTDFIILAKILEKKLPFYCSGCQFISLADRLPRRELYRRDNTSLVISVWGRSKTKYISSGFGFNRTTWNEIRNLKEEFCYFDDYTWENSLEHLASKTRQKAFYMLSVKAPRIFPTNDCTALGNGVSCDLTSTFWDIVDFVHLTANGMFPYKFDLEIDHDGLNTSEVVEKSGGWDDARDRELCMFLASHGRRVYY